MPAVSWWRSVVKKCFRNERPVKKRQQSSTTLQVETLEDRCLPANIFVQGFADGAITPLTPIVGQPGNFNAVNLRSAVFFHNLFPGASSIFLNTTTGAATTYKLTNAFGGQLDVAYAGGANALTIKNRF